MFRVLMVLVALLAVPVASAAHPALSVQVSPPPDDEEGDPYYLWINATRPEAPRAAKPTDDCWQDAGRSPPRPEGALLGIADDIAAWDPVHEPRISGWFPQCVATRIDLGNGSARASYDVTTGRYYVRFDDLFPGVPLGAAVPLGFTISASTITATGTTGVSMVTDCEGCPPAL